MAGSDADFEVVAIRAGEAASSRRPMSGDWGFCCCGDAPGAIGGGVPAFLWFATREAMLAFLREHGAYMNSPPEDASAERMTLATQAAVDAATPDADEALRLALNEALRNGSEILWIGSFDALASSPEAFPVKVRREFREDEDLRASDVPIAKSRRRAFGEFTLGYGM